MQDITIIAVGSTVFGVLVAGLLAWFGYGCWRSLNPTPEESYDIEQQDLAEETVRWEKSRARASRRAGESAALEGGAGGPGSAVPSQAA